MQKGLEFLRSRGIKFDAVLFANDSFLVNGWTLLDQLDSRYLKKLLKKGFVVGQIDSQNIEIKVFDKVFTKWVCTNCFFFPQRVAKKIDTMVSVNDQELDYLINEKYTPGKFFKDNAPISEEYKNLLIVWLTQGWHSKFEINEKSWIKFRNKIRAILNESLLTVRVIELGFNIASYKKKENFVLSIINKVKNYFHPSF